MNLSFELRRDSEVQKFLFRQGDAIGAYPNLMVAGWGGEGIIRINTKVLY